MYQMINHFCCQSPYDSIFIVIKMFFHLSCLPIIIFTTNNRVIRKIMFGFYSEMNIVYIRFGTLKKERGTVNTSATSEGFGRSSSDSSMKPT